MIGHLKSEASARTFGGYLSSLEIRNMVEPDSEGWAVWIYSEDQIEKGYQALTDYIKNPTDRNFQQGADSAAAEEIRQQKEQAAFAKRVKTADQIWQRSDRSPVTLFIIGACVCVVLFCGLNPSYANVRWLLITEGGPPFLHEVRSGQVWRLITPIFIHFGPTHIIFNMLVLWDLGRVIEMAQGSKRMALLTVILGVGSNIGQCVFGTPFFGGMSGVLYGMLGYIWMRSHSEPGSGLGISPMTLGIMLVWFFLCLFQIIPGVANGTHVTGLVMGMIWGAFPMAQRFLKR